jgi:hypothetical protein
MLGAVRALAAMVAISVSDSRGPMKRSTVAAGERRLNRLQAAESLTPADVLANAASLWNRELAGQCRVAPIYGADVVSFRMVRTARLIPAEATRPAAAGVAQLWDRLRAAGFEIADEAEAAQARIRAAEPQPSAAVVRVLKETPRRPRRAAWNQPEVRIAA